jgi:hypothetical protein
MFIVGGLMMLSGVLVCALNAMAKTAAPDHGVNHGLTPRSSLK